MNWVATVSKEEDNPGYWMVYNTFTFNGESSASTTLLTATIIDSGSSFIGIQETYLGQFIQSYVTMTNGQEVPIF